MRAAALAVVLMVVACGRFDFRALDDAGVAGDAAPDATPADPGFTDGTRLHAERWVTADGTAQFADWYDTLLGMRCTLQTTAGGHRCMPADAMIEGYFS